MCKAYVPGCEYSMIGYWLLMSLGLIQASTVSPPPVPTFREAEAGTRTLLFVPIKLNAWLTSPLVNDGLVKVPLFAPRKSEASPLPCHQPTRPLGIGAQGGAEVTESVAIELVAMP